jgi:hypothetical protein
MPNGLVEFWKQCKLGKPPFFHPADEDALWQKEGKFIETNAVSFESFVKNPRSGDENSRRLHLSLRPVPYLGNLARAKIFILLLNPGLAPADYWAETHSPMLRKRLENNLTQSFGGIGFPFLMLDPQFYWCPGFKWWEGKLRETIRRIAREQYNNKYIEAMRDLSRKLACLELVPYHSSSFRTHALIRDLESVKMAKKFVETILTPRAEAGGCTLIVTRQVEEWGFPRGAKERGNVFVYRGGETQGASLSPNSRGGKAILRHYGIIDPAR